MAALQSSRKRGGLLIGIIGLGLLAFIAGDYFKSAELLTNNKRQKVGEIFGETLKYPDYQEKVDELTEIFKFMKMTQGQGNTLTDQEQDQVRVQVWENFKKNVVLKKEAEKIGLKVTDEDIKNALNLGTANSLQLLARIFTNPQSYQFDVTKFQAFLKEYDTNVTNMMRQGQTEAVDQYRQIKRVCDYSLEQLRNELLEQKVYMLAAQSIISNKVVAKYEFDKRNTLTDANVACIPYTTVADKDIQITDADLKAAYKAHKDLPFFRNLAKSADLSLIDVQVVPSDTDRVALEQEMAAIQNQLSAGEDVATVVNGSKTVYPYVNLAQSKKAFEQMPDVAEALDAMAVGSVKPVYYNEQDNTYTTLKLIDKIQAPDSVQYSSIFAVAQTPEESKLLADSIMTALQGGAAFDELAKKYGQTGDTTWVSSAQYEGAHIAMDDATFFTALNTLPVGFHRLSLSQGDFIINIVSKKNVVTKYNLAVVKCPLQFSKQTYNKALNELNRFLANNHDVNSFVKNAAKAGYVIQPVDAYAQSNLQIQLGIGGSRTKEAFKWVFDEAKPGQVSNIYECGRDNDHLLVIGVRNINKDDVLPLENQGVRTYLTQLVKREKKQAILQERLKAVKEFAQATQQPGVLTDTLKDQTLYSFATMQPVGVHETKVSGAISKLQKGQKSGAIYGAAGVYYVEVTDKHNGAETYNEATEKQGIVSRLMQTLISQSPYGGAQEVLLQRLMYQKGDVEDFLYRF